MILNRITVNIGKLTANKIKDIAKSKTTTLAFPYLITILCEKVRACKDGLTPTKSPPLIDLNFVTKYCLLEDSEPAEGRGQSHTHKKRTEGSKLGLIFR